MHIVVVDERVGKLDQYRKPVDPDVSGASFGAERSQRSVALSCCHGVGAGAARSESSGRCEERKAFRLLLNESLTTFL